jgi:hypothetical protein
VYVWWWQVFVAFFQRRSIFHGLGDGFPAFPVVSFIFVVSNEKPETGNGLTRVRNTDAPCIGQKVGS